MKKICALVFGLILTAGAQGAVGTTAYYWESSQNGSDWVTWSKDCASVSSLALRAWEFYALTDTIVAAGKWSFSGNYGSTGAPWRVLGPECSGVVDAVNDVYTLRFWFWNGASWSSEDESWTLTEIRTEGEIVDWDLMGPLLTAVLGLWACAWLFVAIRKAL